jgi:hypothetical protein
LLAYVCSLNSLFDRTISNDDGYTWFRPWRTVLPNPNKAVQALMLQSGAIAILFDNQKGGKTREHRKLSPMTIALSFDNGTTWPYAKVRGTTDARLLTAARHASSRVRSIFLHNRHGQNVATIHPTF